MKYIKRTTIVALLLTATTLWAAEEGVMMDKPSFSASHSRTISAVVEAIDHETRVVTVRRGDGEEITFTASEEARNLDQVAVGDILVAQYIETISVEVLANDGAGAGAAGVSAMARSEKGEMPAMAAMDVTVVTATVEEINLEMNTFKLRGPDGEISQYTARNPDNLRRAEVGDLVVITVTESIAIKVEEQPAE